VQFFQLVDTCQPIGTFEPSQVLVQEYTTDMEAVWDPKSKRGKANLAPGSAHPGWAQLCDELEIAVDEDHVEDVAVEEHIEGLLGLLHAWEADDDASQPEAASSSSGSSSSSSDDSSSDGSDSGTEDTPASVAMESEEDIAEPARGARQRAPVGRRGQAEAELRLHGGKIAFHMSTGQFEATCGGGECMRGRACRLTRSARGNQRRPAQGSAGPRR
jgi:hypothetical protein